MKFLILAFVFCISVAQAETISVANSNYKSAQEGKRYIRFDMVSWKLGLFKSTFKSYVKDFKVTFDRNKNIVSNLKIEFKVESMDTDIPSRNDKMWDYCFGYKEFPVIVVNIKDAVDLQKKEKQVVAGSMTVRGGARPISIDVVASENGGVFEVSGESLLSLKQLNVLDPSNAVGSVDDSVKVYFKL